MNAGECLRLEHTSTAFLKIPENGQRCREFFIGGCHELVPSTSVEGWMLCRYERITSYNNKRIMPCEIEPLLLYQDEQIPQIQENKLSPPGLIDTRVARAVLPWRSQREKRAEIPRVDGITSNQRLPLSLGRVPHNPKVQPPRSH